ncbi:ASCH/PUA domain-containing protein [Clostridium sp.]|uniref:ASCH/PUA domain-containing protein n=1 Tax=Clostridium sp. TaxID=1506 RepID=UPI0028FE4456|nr:ASCH/PUA domain-containing protein [Clostridium sp.]MDU2108471.1 ASCH/PUA domain-containing protein [Clostridium sp.]MDU3354113.1 ASCH/PUA domain-containing protein [Clostridium sp.]
MSKAICINGFAVEMCDDNGFTLENKYFTVEDNSIWNIETDKYRFIGGEIRLTNSDGEWLELSKDHFESDFKILTGKEHALKILPEYFEDVVIGKKTFELRKNDRGFALGDILTLKEFSGDKYTGKEVNKLVTYILTGGKYGLEDGYVILGIK